MKNKISKSLGALALGIASVLPVYSARADEIVAPKPIAAPIATSPKLEARVPYSFTSRYYSNKDGTADQEVLTGPFGKIIYAESYPVAKYGADLKVGDIFGDGNLYRVNLGKITDDDKGTEKSRVEVELSRKDGLLDFVSGEYQDIDGKDIYSGSLGLRFGDLKVQGTANDQGEYGFAALLKTSDHSDIGIGGKHTKTFDLFDGAFDYKFTTGALNGYKLTGHVKFTDFEDKAKKGTLEARVRFGDKAPAGAFLADVKDTDFNTLSGVDDLTFIPSLGKFDLFGASSSISGKAGTVGADFKFKDDGKTKVFDLNAAVGLGSVGGQFFRDMKLQAGYKFDIEHLGDGLFSAEVRGTIWESLNGNVQLGGGVRYEHPLSNGKDDTSVFLGLTAKF